MNQRLSDTFLDPEQSDEDQWNHVKKCEYAFPYCAPAVRKQNHELEDMANLLTGPTVEWGSATLHVLRLPRKPELNQEEINKDTITGEQALYKINKEGWRELCVQFGTWCCRSWLAYCPINVSSEELQEDTRGLEDSEVKCRGMSVTCPNPYKYEIV